MIDHDESNLLKNLSTVEIAVIRFFNLQAQAIISHHNSILAQFADIVPSEEIEL